MRIKELYKPGALASADLGESLVDAAQKMSSNELGSLAIMRDGRFVGIMSERDLVAALSDEVDPRETEISDYMTPSPITVGPDDDAEEVINQMLEAGVRHMPVTVDGKPVGMVSLRDLVALAVWPSIPTGT